MRKPAFAGNWKMYKTPAEAAGFLHDFGSLVAESSHAEIVVCPPFIDIPVAIEAARGTNVAIGVQDLF